MNFLKRLTPIFIFFITAASLGTAIGYYVFKLPELNEIAQLETYKPAVITKIFSSDNQVIKQLYIEKRVSHPTNHFSKYLVDGLISTEDRSFYSHSGISPRGISRAVIKDIVAMSFVEGASTLTQQLAKTLFLSSEKKIKRKLLEMLLAFQIEKKYTKKEILGLYLNQVYFGSGAYGAQAAAQTFFNKSADDLTLEEAALIAGMPKAPSYLSPLNNPDKALARRNQVLMNMFLTGKISKEQMNEAKNTKIQLSQKQESENSYSWYIDHIRQKLEKQLGYDLLYKSGLNIYTALNTKIQLAAEKAVQKHMVSLEKRMKNHKVKSKPECAVIAIDIKTGKVIAMVGGKNFGESKFNRAIQAKRQPGSSFKPLIYALAIKEGYDQNCTLRDVPTIFSVKGQKDWKPKNFSRTYSGELTIRKALAKSKNIPAVRMLERLSPSKLTEFSKSLGIKSYLGNTLSLALGTYETTLIELTNAYGIFPAGGIYHEPWFIEKIEKDSDIIYQKTNLSKRVYPKQEAAIMVDLLQAVMNEGTGKKGQINGYPLGGKTGTTDDYKDALFVGFTPSVAVGVWVGCDDGSSLGYLETGARAALPIWKDVIDEIISQRQYPEYFPVPDKIVYKKFDPDTGKILDKTSNTGVTGLFLQENPNGCDNFS